MEPPLDFQDKENPPRGCLKFNDKLFPVFEGHNTIGRHPKAVVNIKNLNISQQHAVITVVDENTHYISDFNSANGTVVDNKKLNPLKLYRLNNGASIKFADVFCTYKKLEADETILDRTEMSQDFSESFYATNTQTIELQNSNEMILNEMPTQVVGLRSLSIHEMPTQLFNFSRSSDKESQNEENTSNDSIDFMTMQKTSESQMFALNSKTADSDAEGESTSAQPSLESDIVPVKLNTKKTVLSDSERSTPDIIEKKSTHNCSETDDEAPISQICPVRISIKNGIDSDSDTEEYLPQKSRSEDRRRSKYIISDDEETDIEDDNKMMNDSDIVPNTQNTPQNAVHSVKKQNEEPSFTDSFKLQVNESADERAEDKSLREEEQEKKNEEQDEKSEEQQTEKNESASTSEQAIRSAVAEDHIYCRSLDEDTSQNVERDEDPDLQSEKKNVEDTKDVQREEGNKEDTSKESALLDNQKIVRNEEEQKCDDAQPSTSTSSGNHLQRNQDIKTDTDEEATQKLVKDEEVAHISKGKNENEEKDSKSQNEAKVDDDIFDQPTQNIDLNFVNDEEKKLQEEESKTLGTAEERMTVQKEEENKEDNISDEPKQTNLDFMKEKEIDDIYLQSTQEMSTSVRRPIDPSMIYDDDIYLQPTQEVNEINELIKASQSVNAISEDAQMNGEDKESSEENSTSDFTKDRDFVLPLPPDKEKDDNFLIPSIPNITKNPALEEDDDELFLPPTQALELLHKEDETSVPQTDAFTDKEPEKVEDQLEMLFASQSDHMFVATQQLVDVLEDKNESVIEDSMIETDLKKSQFQSIESIRKILDESMSEDDDNKEKSKNSEKSKKDVDGKGTSKKDVNTIKSNVEVKNLKQKNNETGENTKKQKDKGRNRRKTEKDDSSESDNKESNSSSGSSNNSKLTTKKVKVAPQETSTESSVKPAKKLEEKKMTTRSSKVEAVKEVEEKSSKAKKTKKTTESNSENVESAQQKSEEESKKPVKEMSLRRTRSNAGFSTDTEKSVDKSKEQGGQEVEEIVSVRRTRRNTESSAQINMTTDEKSQTKVDTKAKKETDVQIQSESKQEDKENNIRASKRKADSDLEKAPAQKSSESDNSEQETNKRKKKAESSTASNVSKKSNDDQKASSSRMVTRKRSTNTEDEFESKVPKTDSVTKGPGRSTRNRKVEEAVVETPIAETPTTRKSTRVRKSKFDEDEVISISSSASSIANETISTPSSSSTPSIAHPTKRGRKLSANSRALKNEKEKVKGKDEDNSIKTRRGAVKQLSPILASPERTRRVQKPKVAFTMMDSPELESLIRQLGGSVVDTVDACTVLVTGNVKRSEKLLRAVGQAKPICSPQWLQASKKASKFLDPWDYVLEDEEAEQKWDFSLRESLERSSKKKLLENYTFQIMATAATDVLKGAIESCGGKCVNRNLAKAGTDNLVIVATNDQKSKFAKVVKDNPDIKVVEPEAIFDGTLRQEFRFHLHLLK